MKIEQTSEINGYQLVPLGSKRTQKWALVHNGKTIHSNWRQIDVRYFFRRMEDNKFVLAITKFKDPEVVQTALLIESTNKVTKVPDAEHQVMSALRKYEAFQQCAF